MWSTLSSHALGRHLSLRTVKWNKEPICKQKGLRIALRLEEQRAIHSLPSEMSIRRRYGVYSQFEQGAGSFGAIRSEDPEPNGLVTDQV